MWEDEWADLEGTAECALRSVGLYPEEPASAVAIATRLVGPVVVRHFVSMRGNAALMDVSGGHEIWVRPKLDVTTRRWAVAHEVAEWLLRREGVHCEAAAERLAACLLWPRQAAREAFRHEGAAFQRLGDALALDDGSVALRYGEATGRYVVLVEPDGRALRRGEIQWHHPLLSGPISRNRCAAWL